MKTLDLSQVSFPLLFPLCYTSHQCLRNFIYKRTVEPLNFHFKRIQSEIFNLFWSFFYHHIPNITMNWKNSYQVNPH